MNLKCTVDGMVFEEKVIHLVTSLGQRKKSDSLESLRYFVTNVVS